MRILVVAATDTELAPLLQRRQQPDAPGWLSQVDVTVTGVGPVATAYQVTKMLIRGYDYVVQVGLCGTYRRHLVPGTVVQVVTEQLGDTGAEDGRRFLDLFELQLADAQTPPFCGGKLVSKVLPLSGAEELPRVNGLTVCCTSGSRATIRRHRRKYDPDIESMEGAAFFYCCLQEGVPFASLRAVSNVVERRRRHRWKTELAISRLHEVLLRHLEKIQLADAAKPAG